ncbi:hypothetical protein [Paraburkholderia haematera]|uniref:Uncharacterized protein n=1 Tax=Paraburkholderia haematera TaxID=2793077 RepID=A0ABN7KV23_9BURK|nr:hypothetical protein [Paraburkholderia haematera]CAE6713977.1 hypothetical protein R69888_01283 [Paraburkholderia haematera]
MTVDTRDEEDYSRYWNSRTFNEFSSPHIVAWKLARSAIEHENSLVNHRMTWFLLSQAFLFSAFVGVFIGPKDPASEFEPLRPYLLIAVGLFAAYVCLVTNDGLQRAFVALEGITTNYNSLIDQYGDDPIVPRALHYWIKPTLIHQQKLPVATLLLWIALLATCGAYSSSALRAIFSNFGIKGALILLATVVLITLGFLLGSHFSRHPHRP